MSTITDHLKSLHTMSIDARNGYQAALKDAEGHGLTSVFNEMSSMHGTNASQIAAELAKAGENPDDGGSFMSVVHRAIMDVRSLFNGLDRSVLPGLIDGETRNLSSYDEALAMQGLPPTVASVLAPGRARISAAIQTLMALKNQSAAPRRSAM
jgi:uncharacterized protein (TIGR02284 family)